MSCLGVTRGHEHYGEPFAGGLSVLLAKEKSKLETVNDLDQPDELMQVCALPHARVELADATDRADLTGVERARRI